MEKIILTEQDIKTITTKNNKVLLLPVDDPEIVSFGKKNIYIDTTYNPENHQHSVFMVISTPTNLYMTNENLSIPGMEWKTEMELSPGDIVFLKYLEAIQCTKIYTEENVYYLAEYDQIFCRMRPFMPCGEHKIMVDINNDGKEYKESQAILPLWFDLGTLVRMKGDHRPYYVNNNGKRLQWPKNVIIYKKINPKDKSIDYAFWEVQMINGYILIETIMSTNALKGLIKLFKRNIPTYGHVRYIGKPNDFYVNEYDIDGNSIKVGDLVHLEFKVNQPMERYIKKEFDGKDYIVTQRRRLLGIVKKPDIIKY